MTQTVSPSALRRTDTALWTRYSIANRGAAPRGKGGGGGVDSGRETRSTSHDGNKEMQLLPIRVRVARGVFSFLFFLLIYQSVSVLLWSDGLHNKSFHSAVLPRPRSLTKKRPNRRNVMHHWSTNPGHDKTKAKEIGSEKWGRGLCGKEL